MTDRSAPVTETRTVTLTEFLLARITEDEWMVRDASCHGADWRAVIDDQDEGYPSQVLEGDGSVLVDKDYCNDRAPHIARWSPARVQVECAAKRRIIEAHPVEFWYGVGYCETCPSDWPCPTMRALASVYSDHPDFNPAWK
jgi:hypothetical protein